MNTGPIGILLAGGQARRMGGGDKSLRRIAGVPLLAYAIRRLERQCATLLLSANGDIERFAEFGLPVVADDIAGFAGPLAGLLAGLDYVAAHHPETPWAVTVATDTPFFPIDFVARLQAARDAGDAALACARSGGSVHPIMALWPVAARHQLRHTLTVEGIRKVELFMSRYAIAYVDWPIEPFDPFFNINTPADLAEAEHILAEITRSQH